MLATITNETTNVMPVHLVDDTDERPTGCYPRLVATLARATMRGHLPVIHAHAAIAASIARGVRRGTLPGTGTVEERIHIDVHIFGLHIDTLAATEARTIGAIGRVLRPLIGIGAPRNRLLAEAFNVNEDHGSPLSEQQVRGGCQNRSFLGDAAGAPSCGMMSGPLTSGKMDIYRSQKTGR